MPLRASLQHDVSLSLGANSYGKAGIRLAVVRRDAERHTFTDLDIAVRFAGDFEAAHVDGDNSALLPTDTMRATCYALAQGSDVSDTTAFALALCQRFLQAAPAADLVEVEIEQQPWERIVADGLETPHAFRQGAGARRVTTVSCRRNADPVVTAGLRGLRLLKTAGSAFSGFLRDEHTTLEETRDRILATTLEARWGYDDGEVDHPLLLDVVEDTLVSTFARHESESVQHTLHELGSAVISSFVEVAWIRLRMPNEHHIAADLSAQGLDNDGEVFVVTREPFGVIEATVEREGWPAPEDRTSSLW